MNKEITMQYLGIDINNSDECKYIAGISYKAFCVIYLPHYFFLEPAEFHHELIDILTNDEEEAIGVVGFRGSAKSTHCSMAFPLWCALYKRYNFPILINDTGKQRDLSMQNIKTEIEDNELVRRDFPQVRNKTDKWTKDALLLSNGVYLLGLSRGQKIRGLRHKQYRPDIIICDDLEDLEWVRKKENRDKTERWFKGEVIPAQDELKCKMILIGNMLHNDALMMRIKKMGIYRFIEFPLIKKDGNITWTGKYPNMEAVEKQKKKVGSSSAWSREYLLKVISEDDQVIKDEDITKYPASILNETNDEGKKILKIKNGCSAVDLAISVRETADYTAIISGIRADYLGRERILIKPNPINRRMDFATTIKVIGNVHASMPLGSNIVVEDIAYQKAAIQELKRKGFSVKGIRPITDKKARLETVAPYIKDGTVLFADIGCEELIEQLVGFGVEAHDDMVDALVYLILEFAQKKQGVAGVGKIDAM